MDRVGRVLLLVAAFGVSALAAEGVSRLVHDPVDFLLPELVADSVLPHRIAPGSAGHDAWGFRNREVPGRADIVTIGDSQTYGISARARDAWPAALARQSGRVVYNLSLGGYGPTEYLHLLESRAMDLKPRHVIVGLYLGNDFFDVARALATAARSETPTVSKEGGAPSSVVSPVRRHRLFVGQRDWLARHSVLYRMITISAVGNLVRSVETRARKTEEEQLLLLNDSEAGVLTAFLPETRIPALDVDREDISRGLDRTLEIFSKMERRCRRDGAALLILLIPTKERVHEELIGRDPNLANSESLRGLLDLEAQAHQRVVDFLTRTGIDYLDSLPALKRAVRNGPLYPANDDGHPDARGYKVLADEVAHHLFGN